jgi:hypothetical protein
MIRCHRCMDWIWVSAFDTALTRIQRLQEERLDNSIGMLKGLGGFLCGSKTTSIQALEVPINDRNLSPTEIKLEK